MVMINARRLTGIDGKEYDRHPMRTEDRDRVIGRCHWLKHAEGLSVRLIRDQLLYNHNPKRSVGSIAAYLAMPCTECSGDASLPPEQSAAGGVR